MLVQLEDASGFYLKALSHYPLFGLVTWLGLNILIESTAFIFLLKHQIVKMLKTHQIRWLSTGS